MHAEVVRLCAVLRTPDLLEQLSTGDQLPGIAGQDLHEMPLGGRELRYAVRSGDPFVRKVNQEVLGPETGDIARRQTTPQSGPQPCEEFSHSKGFRHVVIGSCVERGNLVEFGVAGGQNDNRDL